MEKQIQEFPLKVLVSKISLEIQVCPFLKGDRARRKERIASKERQVGVGFLNEEGCSPSLLVFLWPPTLQRGSHFFLSRILPESCLMNALM